MIREFKGEYRWLSNMYPCKIVLRGIEYPSVEHAFQSEKNESNEWKLYCSREINPKKVKLKSKRIDLVENWNEKRVIVMEFCIDKKFSQEPFKTKLIETGNEEIQEGNHWGDIFWGVDLKSNKGKNVLGKIIMEKRRKLQ
jgi:hypothetical protein